MQEFLDNHASYLDNTDLLKRAADLLVDAGLAPERKVAFERQPRPLDAPELLATLYP